MSTATIPVNDPFTLEVPAKGDGGEYELCPAGNHPGYLVGIIDMGTQHESYNGKPKELRKGALILELTAEMKSDGEPFILGLEVTLSLNEKAKLRAILENWRGQKYAEGERIDLLAALAKPCLINVTHSASADGKKSYHNVGGISAVPKGMVVPKYKTEPFHYSVTSGMEPPEHEWLPRLFGNVIADIVRDSAEYKARKGAANGHASTGVAGGDDINDPPPF